MKVHENTTNLPSRWVNAMFIFMTFIAMVAGYLSELTNIYGTFVVLPFAALTTSVFFKVVVIICLLIKQLPFLDLGERHQQAHSF